MSTTSQEASALVGKILVVEDDPAQRSMVAEFLSDLGHRVDEAGTLADAHEQIHARVYDLVLSDLMLEPGSGIDLLQAIRRAGLPTEVIIMTGYGGVERAVEAMREGAYHFVTKPLDYRRLEFDVLKALEKRRLEEENLRLRAPSRERFGNLVGASASMRETFALLDRAARSEATVLLLGASGTGKDVAARAIHDASPRADEPFVAIHCGAIAHDLLEAELFGHERGAFTGAHAARPGLFERAGRGTVFLDEIAAAPGRVQVGLLRVLQERQVRRIGARRPTATPARIIAATNADLDDALAAGRFRQDLYYRLAALIVRLPDLAERREDIPVLVAEICRRLGERDRREVSVSPRALQRLASFEWRGNVRELEHVLEQAALVASGGTIRERDILALEQAEPAPVRTLLEVERDHIREVLRACGGNRARAARLLDVPRATLYRKMRQLGIRESEEVEGADEPTDPERSPDAIEAESRSPATE